MEETAVTLPTPRPFSKAFFDLYLTEPKYGEEYDLDEEPVSIHLIKSIGFGLRLDVALSLSMADLYIVHPNLPEPAQIAYTDQAHWRPHALRVEEVEMFCGGVQTTLAPDSPSIPLFDQTSEVLRQFSESAARVLLAPFTVATREDEQRQYAAVTDSLAILGFVPQEIAALKERAFFPVFGRYQGVEWIEVQSKWVVAGDYAYAFRGEENAAFPHRELNDVIRC
ncbi:MAG: hypothetical protein K2P58_02400 [Hyphomonadaceae bacterium]|nr:hypothetical protein [Hyphomonadaceae bacterium]